MGIENGQDYDNEKNKNVKTEVCVIGSGPAGITAAWHLQKKGVKVTLIEGSRDFRDQEYKASWPDKALLYNGVADGLFATNEPKFLTRPYDDSKGPWERERVYGGTSNHWAGQCRPLDAFTFEQREGFLPWPISRQDLDDYYAQAATFLKLSGDFSDKDKDWAKFFCADYWAKKLGLAVPKLVDFDSDPKVAFDTEIYQWNNINFATEHFEGKPPIGDLVDVILNASLLKIEHDGRRVNRLHVASMKMEEDKLKPATEFFIEAKAYVLACGAVANAHQLLLSNAGNEHHQVGCNFICHPIAGKVYTMKPTMRELLTPEDEYALMATASTPDGVPLRGRFSPNVHAQQGQEMWKIGGCWFDPKSDDEPNYGYYFEMAPNPNSHVTLADTPDKVFPPQKQTKITWEVSDRDEQTYTHSTMLFKTAVEKLAMERGKKVEISFAPWDKVKSNLVINGHHIGTTRMSNKPEVGVVDKNLKVHSLDNLYIAGSSVFPSAGISNPTFTIVTLSIRLAEHLSGLLKGSTTG